MKKTSIAIKSYDNIIRNHITQKNLVKINRTFKSGEENISGFILSLSNEYVMIQIENDFLLDGYGIFRKDQFTSIRCNKFDKKHKSILKAEGILDQGYGINKSIDLSSWQEIFIALKKYDYHVIVECDDLEEPGFTIGQIKRVNKSSVNIRYYNPAGELEENLTSVNYKDITLVIFEDRYSKIFRKYLTERKKIKR